MGQDFLDIQYVKMDVRDKRCIFDIVNYNAGYVYKLSYLQGEPIRSKRKSVVML